VSQTSLEAYLAAITGEEAAAYAYGVAIPRLPGTSGDQARGALAAHRLAIIALREQVPPDEQPLAPGGFVVATPVDEAGARQLLGEVEQRLAAVYADLAAATDTDARLAAVRSARECAVRSVAWGQPPQAFPGR
jgi:hypothetical protein